MEEMVKYLFSTSIEALQPPRRAQTTLAPTFHALVNVSGRVEQTVQEGKQGAVWGCIVNGTSHNDSVEFIQPGGGLVYQILKDALAGLVTGTASGTAPDGLGTYLQNFTVYAVFIENFGHLVQSKSGVSVDFGAAVKNQNFHVWIPP